MCVVFNRRSSHPDPLPLLQSYKSKSGQLRRLDATNGSGMTPVTAFCTNSVNASNLACRPFSTVACYKSASTITRQGRTGLDCYPPVRVTCLAIQW